MPPPNSPTGEQLAVEYLKCRLDPCYFTDTYCHLYDATTKGWRPFRPWPAQFSLLDDLAAHRRVVLLKARQLGFTWAVLAHCLHQMLFYPAATVLLFSKRDDEAVDLLDFRLKGMYERLPPWLREGRPRPDAGHAWGLPNGSRAMAFPTTGGRSHTATIAVMDEADWMPDLGKALAAVKPTVDAGGQLILLSTPDRDRPGSEFKRVYKDAKNGKNNYRAIFHGWRARPGRTAEWYAETTRDMLPDDRKQEYPETDEEALSQRSEGAEFPPEWFGAGIWFDTWPAEIVLRALVCDPSKSRDSKAGDYAAWVFLAKDRQGCLWVDAWLRRCPATEVVEDGYELYRQLHPLGVGMESNQWLELFALMFHQVGQREKVTLPIYTIHNSVKKEVRIRRLAPWLAQGRMRFRAGSPGCTLLVDQLKAFPAGDFDDGPDACEQGIRLLEYLASGAEAEHTGIQVLRV